MNTLSSLYQSLFNLTWLKGRRQEKGSAWANAILFLLVVSVLRDMPLLWTIPRAINEFASALERQIPDFRAQFQGGKLFVDGPAQPYVYKSPESSAGQFVVVVDTVSTSTPDISSYLADAGAGGILVSREKIVIFNAARGETRTQSWKDLSGATFTRSDVIGWVKKFSGTLGYFIAPVLIVFVFIFWTIGKLAQLVLISFVAFVVAAIGKRGWKFGEIYRVGLFALTAPTLLLLVLSWVNITVPFVYSAVLLAYLLGVIFLKESAPVAKLPENQAGK